MILHVLTMSCYNSPDALKSSPWLILLVSNLAVFMKSELWANLTSLVVNLNFSKDWLWVVSAHCHYWFLSCFFWDSCLAPENYHIFRQHSKHYNMLIRSDSD